jgi:hypothetical protein
MQWKCLAKLVEIRSPWVTLHGERWQDDKGKDRDYWRVERADSMIVLPLFEGTIVLPPPAFRVGVGQKTWDFPGGRWSGGQPPREVAEALLERELGVRSSQIKSLTPLNESGWCIKSSFSNQRLYGYVAQLTGLDLGEGPATIGRVYKVGADGVRQLLQDLECLQCRGVLLEWLQQGQGDG